MTNQHWRALSVFGVVLTLGVALFQSFPLEPRQGRGFVLAGLIVVAALIVLRTLFSSAWHVLMQHTDLLVPVGVVMLATTAVELAAMLPMLRGILVPSWAWHVLTLSLSVSLLTVLQMIVWTAYAAWQTDLLWRFTHGYTRLDLDPWPPIRRYFWRAFVALAIGVTVLFACLVPIIAIGAASFAIALVALTVLGLAWNFLTAALLPVVMYDKSSIAAAVGAGIGQSRRLCGRWWRQLVALLLLFGMAIALQVHFTTAVDVAVPGSQMSNVQQQTKANTKWQVNAFWLGGYENQCRWYSKYAEALETQPLPVISEALAMVFLVLAVSMKLHVLRELALSQSEAMMPADNVVDADVLSAASSSPTV